MGAYTELIFGATLKRDTPIEIIETLKYMLGEQAYSQKTPYPKIYAVICLGMVVIILP